VGEYFLLVIDDFHILAANKAIVDMVDRLVQRAPENMCLVLSTRETPQFPSLPRLLSQRRVSGIGKDELRFNAEEIQQVLAENFDHKVTLKETAKLEADSEGWITAIVLTSQPLWQGLFKEMLTSKGEHSLIFQYLASEVFTRQSDELRVFLLRTAVRGEFDLELAAVVSGVEKPAKLIEEVESRGLFLNRLSGEGTWYRPPHVPGLPASALLRRRPCRAPRHPFGRRAAQRNGKISVDSKKEEDTTFWMHLPIVATGENTSPIRQVAAISDDTPVRSIHREERTAVHAGRGESRPG